MRPWFLVLLSILALLALGCPNDDVVDDDSAADDDDDDDDNGDDDTTEDAVYVPPPDLGPWFEWDPYDLDSAVESGIDCLQYALPSYPRSLIDLMESLVTDHENAICPDIQQSGPPDEVLTTVTGNCETDDGWAFNGSYTMKDTDAGSFHIYTYDVDQFYVRPADNDHEAGDIQDDEYFFHGHMEWTYNGDDVFGTFGMGLGGHDTEDPDTDESDGFEAHYADGAYPGTPAWNHVYIKGWSEAVLNADQQVEYSHDLYITSSGFWTFTSNAIALTSDESICGLEPISGAIGITATPLSIMFLPDGESSCDGNVTINGGSHAIGTFTDSIW